MPFGGELGSGTGGRTVGMGFSVTDNLRQKFTSYERDNETGLDFAEARFYSNLQERFTSVDPLMSSAVTANPQTFNRYSYVTNSPLNIIDPTGMFGICPGGGQGGQGGMPLGNFSLNEPTERPQPPQPPGQIAPPAATAGASAPDVPQNPAQPQPQQDPACTRVNALFDDSGQGYYTYGPQNQRYGQPGMVAALQNFASGWNQDHPDNPIGVGDLSQFGGAPNWARHPGGGHAAGVIADLRPMRNDNVRGPTNFNDRTYSFDLTNPLVQGLLGLPEVASVRFNDPNIQGTVRDARGHVHDNHLHVTFRNAIGCP